MNKPASSLPDDWSVQLRELIGGLETDPTLCRSQNMFASLGNILDKRSAIWTPNGRELQVINDFMERQIRLGIAVSPGLDIERDACIGFAAIFLKNALEVVQRAERGYLPGGREFLQSLERVHDLYSQAQGREQIHLADAVAITQSLMGMNPAIIKVQKDRMQRPTT